MSIPTASTTLCVWVFITRLLSQFAVSLDRLGIKPHKVLRKTGHDLCALGRTEAEPYNRLLIMPNKVICFICLPFGSLQSEGKNYYGILLKLITTILSWRLFKRNPLSLACFLLEFKVYGKQRSSLNILDCNR